MSTDATGCSCPSLTYVYYDAEEGRLRCSVCRKPATVVVTPAGVTRSKQYEYDIRHVNEEDRVAFMMRLNELGQESWKIFQIGPICEVTKAEVNEGEGTCCSAFVYMRRRWQP